MVELTGLLQTNKLNVDTLTTVTPPSWRYNNTNNKTKHPI